MAPTLEQQGLVDAIVRVLGADPEIEAAWLGGSLGRGAGDAFSDVDIVALVADAPAAQVGLRYSRDVASIAEPALVNVLYGGRVINVVTTDWGRFDISFIEPVELARFSASQLTALFNRGSRNPPRDAPAAYQTEAPTVLRLVNEFLRVLGMLVGCVGREEYLLGLAGADILRRLTIDLMLEDNGVGPTERGGALRRNPLLTPDQQGELEALAPVAANRAGIIAANTELAAIFLPRARRLADRIGMEWPLAFETATKRHLRDRLGLLID